MRILICAHEHEPLFIEVYRMRTLIPCVRISRTIVHRSLAHEHKFNISFAHDETVVYRILAYGNCNMLFSNA